MDHAGSSPVGVTIFAVISKINIRNISITAQQRFWETELQSEKYRANYRSFRETNISKTEMKKLYS